MNDLKKKCIYYNIAQTLQTSPLQLQHVSTLLSVAANNKNKLKMNSEVHNINSTQKFNFRKPLTNLSLYQNGIYSSGIQVFNLLALELFF
jgi:hypothetical protein